MLSRITIIILTVMVWASVNAQSSITPFGLAGMQVPTDSGETYRLKWARIGFGYSVDGISGKFEYDFYSNKLQKAYGEKNLNSQITITAGYMVMPIAWLYPSPKSLAVTQFPGMFSGTTVTTAGLGLTYTVKNGPIFRANSYGDGQMSATVSWQGISAFWADREAYGLLVDRDINTFLNPYVGFSVRPSGRTFLTAQNHWKFAKNCRFYGQYDRIENISSGLVGVNYEYAANCFVKVFREFSENSRPVWSIQTTFSF